MARGNRDRCVSSTVFASMATPAELAARRSRADQARVNGAKSRGPKTDEGKAASARNAWKHGLCAEGIIFPCEEPEVYWQFVDDFVRELGAVGTVQTFLAKRAALQAWKLRRLPQLEAGTLYARRPEDRDPKDTLGGLGDLVCELAGHDTDGALLRLHRYEQRIERSMRACLRELRTVQAAEAERLAAVSRVGASASPQSAAHAATAPPPATPTPATAKPPGDVAKTGELGNGGVGMVSASAVPFALGSFGLGGAVMIVGRSADGLAVAISRSPAAGGFVLSDAVCAVTRQAESGHVGWTPRMGG
jgi:hypothetical protein